MFSASVKAQSKLGSASIILALFVLVVSSLASLITLKNNINELVYGFEEESEVILPLVQTTESMRYDVAQVQQWLTDISATRARDGLNDGFDEAAAFADQFASDLDKAYVLLERMSEDPKLKDNVVSVRAALDSARDAFPGYYSMGQKMAQSYIDHGPSEGNKLMGDFDAHAAAINDGVGQIREAIQVVVELEAATVGQIGHTTQASATLDILIICAIGLLAVIMSLFIAYRQNTTINEISRATDVINRAALGDLNHRVVNVQGHGEIADLQHNVNDLLDQVDIFLNEAGGTMDHVADSNYYRTIDTIGLRGSFSQYAEQINAAVAVLIRKNEQFVKEATSIGERLGTVASDLKRTAQQLQVSSDEMETVAEDTNSQSNTVANSAHDASSNVQSVASATEQFSASIGEISSQVDRSAQMSGNAVNRVREADEKVSGLSGAANKIGEVLALITDIADQTNLLALNATIEAARAGEAGKGFAVVASEVKNLANQTAKATEEISAQINGMQSATRDVIEAIQQIGVSINEIETVGSTISDTVKEQKDVVTEVSRAAQGAVAQVGVVAESIQSVSQGAQTTANSVTQIGEAASGLSEMSSEILSDVENFVERVKSI